MEITFHNKSMQNPSYTIVGNIILLIAILKSTIGNIFGFSPQTLDTIAPYFGYFLTYLLNRKKINEGISWICLSAKNIFFKIKLWINR